MDKQWRLERERCERLESELAFYQNHSAQALSDRDKVKRWLSSRSQACCSNPVAHQHFWRLSVLQGGPQCCRMGAGQSNKILQASMVVHLSQ